MRKFFIAFLVLLVTLVTTSGVIVFNFIQLSKQKKQTDVKIAALQKQISGLQGTMESLSGKLGDVTDASKKAVALSQQEIEQRQAVRTASEDELLTQAVAKATPAVVSIVVSKEVPNLEVTYQNPFGDDPFFQNFSMQIPVYKQNGTIQKKVGAGTGFFIRSDGYIVTNRHVVSDADASYTVLLNNGKQLPGTVVYRDQVHDLAIVKVAGTNFPTLSLGDSNTIKLGQRVVAIGNALGEYNNSVSVGIISGLNRTITAGDAAGGNNETLSGVLQTDAAINPGNSGGPLIDLSGNALGVNVATVTGSNNISFSIPANIVQSVVAKVIK